MASRKSSDPQQPPLNFMANIQIKEDKDEVPIKVKLFLKPRDCCVTLSASAWYWWGGNGFNSRPKTRHS